MKTLVELTPFPSDPDQSQRVREVDVPVSELRLTNMLDITEALDLVYKYGQNDFQEQPVRSICCGDVIKYHGVRYLVCGIGFKVMQPDEESPGLTKASFMHF